MKAKFKFLTLMAVTLLLGFSSCSKDENDDQPGDNTPKKISLKISNGAPSPKSEGGAVEDATSVSFTSGNLYFVNGAGVILKHYTLSGDPSDDTNINIDEIESGATIENIPGAVEAVHIAGNTPDLPTGGNISTVRETALSLVGQMDITGVNLYGTGAIQAPLVEGNPHTCELTLSPTVARIEMTDITGGGAITGFKVDGIFIDNYFSVADVAGTPDDLVYNGEDSGAFGDDTPEYPSTIKGAIYDFYTPALESSGNVVVPETEDMVWGYQLYAGSQVPRIVIRLSGITTSDGSSYADPQFVTIRGFKNGGNSLSSIEAGKVYHIGSGAFSFDEGDITPEPNQEPIDVDVTVTLATWEVVGVEVEL